MNYYKRHIGDYAKKTGHLSPLEHGVYNLILDSYYDREIGPTATDAIRWARARTDEEKAAVQIVLNEFFKLGEDGRYTQVQVEQNLQAYHAQAKANQITAIEREKRKREREENEQGTIRAQGVNEDNTTGQPNHKPLTTNHKPEEKHIGEKEDKRKGTRLPIDWILPEKDEEYCKSERPDLNPSDVAKLFYNYWIAVPGAKGRKLDWSATWRNWVLTQNKKQQPQATKPAMSDKFNVGNIDYSSTDKAQAESFEKHGIRPQDYADTDQIEF